MGLSAAHRVGVGFPEGRGLLPFYADPGREATFTVLQRFQAANFYRFTTCSTFFAFARPPSAPHTYAAHVYAHGPLAPLSSLSHAYSSTSIAVSSFLPGMPGCAASQPLLARKTACTRPRSLPRTSGGVMPELLS